MNTLNTKARKKREEDGIIVYHKLCAIIDSCITMKQLLVAINCIDNAVSGCYISPKLGTLAISRVRYKRCFLAVPY
jgi:hypothetical protein